MSETLVVHTSCSIIISHSIGIAVSYNMEGGGCIASMAPAYNIYVFVNSVHIEEKAPKREYRDVCFLLMTLFVICNLPQYQFSMRLPT